MDSKCEREYAVAEYKGLPEFALGLKMLKSTRRRCPQRLCPLFPELTYHSELQLLPSSGVRACLIYTSVSGTPVQVLAQSKLAIKTHWMSDWINE